MATPSASNINNNSSSSLNVAVRIRPLNEDEKQKKAFKCVYPLDEQRVLLVDPEKFENNILRQNRQFERQFVFDVAFGPESTQTQVHNKTTGPLVDFVVGGQNATVFAYGPTGSGKTYTMVGTRERPGLMTQLTQALYEKINPNELTVYISFMEIYNEEIRDLLNPNAGVLDLLEDEWGNVQVPGILRVRAPNTNKIMQILQEGNSRRTQEPTAANKSSSRSHALLQVGLYKNTHQHGKLFLIDLAGSERASNTQNKGQRLKEGAAINRSLLALGNVINALSSGNRGRYINYRDSKLTRLLKDSLGGEYKTCMIAHVSPSSTNYNETYNTLIYANRAKSINTRLTFPNRPNSADQEYSGVIRQIRREVAARTNNISHASSTMNEHIPNSKSNSNTHAKWSNSHPANIIETYNSTPNLLNNRKFSSLFNTLKEQFLCNCEKQLKLREKLLKANCEAIEAEMNRFAKMAILLAWEKHTSEDEEKYSNIIEKIKMDSIEQEKKLSQLQEVRQKLEKALRKGAENQKSLENRMRSIASKDGHQNEFIDLLVRMSKRDTERMATTSDSVLQNLRLQRQENSFAKIQRYEQIADKLIAGNLAEEERVNLHQEYRTIKNQLNYQLFPLKQMNTLNKTSWNRQMLDLEVNRNKIGEKFFQINENDDFGKTYLKSENVEPRQRIDTYANELFQLPEINKNSEKNSLAETPNDSGTEMSSVVEAEHLPKI